MSMNGIWKVEMLGPYGWEAMSTGFMEDGRYLASSQSHYTVGRYELTGDQVIVTAVMHSHGETRTLFGHKNPLMELSFTGTLSGDQIKGQAEDKKAEYSITFRAIRIADLP